MKTCFRNCQSQSTNPIPVLTKREGWLAALGVKRMVPTNAFLKSGVADTSDTQGGRTMAACQIGIAQLEAQRAYFGILVHFNQLEMVGLGTFPLLELPPAKFSANSCDELELRHQVVPRDQVLVESVQPEVLTWDRRERRIDECVADFLGSSDADS